MRPSAHMDKTPSRTARSRWTGDEPRTAAAPSRPGRRRPRGLTRLPLLVLIPLLVGMLGGPASPVGADELSDARARQNALAKQLRDQKEQVAQINALQADLSTEISATRRQLNGINADLATVKKSITLTWVAVTLLSCAALTKGASAYPFYAAVGLVLLCHRDPRAFLLRPGVIGPHLVAAGLYVLWHRHLIGSAQQSMDVTAVMEKLRAFDLRHYLIQLWSFPVELALRFVPASLLVAYCALRERAGGAEAQPWAPSFATAAWMALLGVLPYWLWPDTGSRYVLPLYALAAFLLAHLLWHQNLLRVRFVVNCLLAVIAVKYVAALWVFPAYLREHRGDYAALAADIEALTKGFALYATDVSATGLSVVANIDARRFPQQPLQWPPREWSAGFVLANAENPEVGLIFRKYAVGGKPLYVLCRGEACAVRRTP